MDPARLQRLPLRLFSAENSFAFLLNRIPWMSNVAASFRLTGAMLLSFDPDFFISNLRLELAAFPFSVCSEIWDVIKEKIAFDASQKVADGLDPAIRPEIAARWASASKPSYPEPQNLLGLLGSPGHVDLSANKTPSTLPQFNSSFTGYPPAKKFAFSSPHHAQLPSQYGQMAFAQLPSQYGQTAPAQLSSLNGQTAPPAQLLSQNSQTAPPSHSIYTHTLPS
jgi:hypothetical protein